MQRESLSFVNSEGKKLFAMVHRPVKSKKTPAVLFFHGLAGNKCGKHRLYVRLGDVLAENGIASLRFDLTGCGDSEGEFSEASIKKFMKDGKKALETFRSMPFIDPERIGIFGRSFGGCLAALFASENSSIKSLALWASFFSPEPWKHIWEEASNPKTTPERRKALMRFGEAQGGDEFFKEIFSLNVVESLGSLDPLPLLLIHGKKDEIVPFQQAEAFIEARNNAKGKTRLLSLEEGDHDFSLPESQERALRETSKWFQETL